MRPINEQGDKVKLKFFEYLANYHNISRRSLETNSIASNNKNIETIKADVKEINKLNKFVAKKKAEYESLTRRKEDLAKKKVIKPEIEKAKDCLKSLRSEAVMLNKQVKSFVPMLDKPDSVLPKLREIILSNKGAGFPTQKIIENFRNTSKDIFVDKAFIEQKVCESVYGSADTYLILSLITELDPQHAYNVDHMFPKSMFTPKSLKKIEWITPNSDVYKFYSNSSNWNTVGNLQLLNASENKFKNDSKLDIWLGNNPQYNKDLYFVPNDPKTGRYLIADNDFLHFVEQRRKLIVEAVMNSVKI